MAFTALDINIIQGDSAEEVGTLVELKPHMRDAFRAVRMLAHVKDLTTIHVFWIYAVP